MAFPNKPAHICRECHTRYSQRSQTRYSVYAFIAVGICLLLQYEEFASLPGREKSHHEIMMQNAKRDAEKSVDFAIAERDRKAAAYLSGQPFVEREYTAKPEINPPYPEASFDYTAISLGLVFIGILLARIRAPCPSCGARRAIPSDSPAGRRILAELSDDIYLQSEPPKKSSILQSIDYPTLSSHALIEAEAEELIRRRLATHHKPEIDKK